MYPIKSSILRSSSGKKFFTLENVHNDANVCLITTIIVDSSPERNYNSNVVYVSYEMAFVCNRKFRNEISYEMIPLLFFVFLLEHIELESLTLNDFQMNKHI